MRKAHFPPLGKRRRKRSQQQNLVRCDECQTRFQPQVEHRPLKDGGEWVMFECPRCQKQYTVARVTKRGKQIHERIKAVRQELSTLVGMQDDESVARRESLLAEFEGLRGEIEYEVRTG